MQMPRFMFGASIPSGVVTALADVDGWLYRLIQLAIREAVAFAHARRGARREGRARRGAA